MLNETFSIVFSAPSGAGKTTLIQRLIAQEPIFEFSVSTTTRSPRSGEREGVHYYFVDDETFNGLMDREELIEWALVHENRYGTTKKEVDRIRRTGKIPVFDVDVQGARTLKKKLPDAVFVFIIPPSLTVLYERLRARDTESESQIEIRIRNALRELSEYGMYDYIVVNDRLEEALSSINAILKAEKCRMARMEKIMRTRGLLDDNTVE